ncbi:MAG TPA: hypothetical protein VF733_01600 [Candidatus Saccharimonadales bacterium]
MNPDQVYQTNTQPPVPSPSPVSDDANRRPAVPFIGKILGILILIAFLFMAYLVITKNRAEATSKTFMSYMTDGNVEQAMKLTSASPNDKSFFDSASVALKGGSSKLIESDERDKKQYFLYELNGSSSKYARTTLEEQDSKWVVTVFVHNKERLKLIPDASTDAESPKEATPAPTKAACLMPGDFDTIFKQINGNTATLGALDYSKPTNPYTNNVHFNPDTLDFSAPAALNQGVVNAFAAFGKQYSDKTFTISLRGSVGTTKQSDLDFARQRSEKIKNLLIAGGTPANKIVIENPGSVGDYGTNDSVSKQTARNVVIRILPACDQSSTADR